MPEKPFIQISYGPVNLTTPTQADEPGKKFGLKALAETVSALWTILFRVVLAGSLAAVLWVTVTEVLRNTVVIEEIGLPKTLSDMGYSGSVAAHRLWDSAVWVNELSKTSKDRVSLLADTRQLEITEPGTGLSLSGLVQVARRLLGQSQTVIAGEFVCRDGDCSIEAIELRLRAFQDSRMLVANVGPIGEIRDEQDIEAYFDNAALELLRIIDPYVVASFIYTVAYGDQSHDRARRLLVADADNKLTSLPAMVEAEARKVASASPEQRPWALNLLGLHHAEVGDHERALVYFQQAADLSAGEDTEIYGIVQSNWGLTLIELGRNDDALKKYAEAVRLDPGYAGAYNNWGNALYALGRHDEAIKKYVEAVRLDPEDAGAYNNWGNALSDLGRADDAIGRYSEAVRLDSENADAYVNWGNALYALGRYQEAIKKYTEALRFDPENVNAHIGFGASLSALGRHEEAIEKYTKVVRFEPENTFAYNNWAIALSGILSAAGDARCEALDRHLPSYREVVAEANRLDLLAEIAAEEAACDPAIAAEPAAAQ